MLVYGHRETPCCDGFPGKEWKLSQWSRVLSCFLFLCVVWGGLLSALFTRAFLVYISLFLPSWSTTSLPDSVLSSPFPWCSDFKALLPRQDRAPRPELRHWTWSVAADLSATQDLSLWCLKSPASSVHLLRSFHLLAQSAQTLPASPFIQGFREDPSTPSLTSLTLQSLLTFFHRCCTYFTYVHLLQTRWSSPQPQREVTPRPGEPHPLSVALKWDIDPVHRKRKCFFIWRNEAMLSILSDSLLIMCGENTIKFLTFILQVILAISKIYGWSQDICTIYKW